MKFRKIAVSGVSKFDALQLENELTEQDFEKTEAKLSEGQHGDLGLSVIAVVISLAAITVLATYLLRKHKEETWTEEIEGIDENGNRFVRRVVYRKKTSEAPRDTVIKAIAEALSIDLSTLLS